MIKLQILLHQPWRTSEGIERVRELIKSLGIKPTVDGRTTVSAEISKDAFDAIFKIPVQKVAAQPPGSRDFGRSGGDVSGDLPIPEALREYVESITVASPYLRI